jgi:hypothetical protein
MLSLFQKIKQTPIIPLYRLQNVNQLHVEFLEFETHGINGRVIFSFLEEMVKTTAVFFRRKSSGTEIKY